MPALIYLGCDICLLHVLLNVLLDLFLNVSGGIVLISR